MPIKPQPEWVLSQRRTVGDRIRAARLAANLSQMRLATMLGVDHRTIHRIEHGTSDPGLGLLLMLSNAVDVPLAELMRE
ncbi:helix-turn-helix domain-containing protein [Streptomyces sp. NPDC057136]|uniref:helix-turn-helix domain-containing protein n=1 Tax=Streptomyces sp. NPDC057136 TaxID=3346029 RepID=UPI00363B19FC